MKKTLVAYFSAGGTTKNRAVQLADTIHADLYEITPKKRYSEEDLDWMNKRSRTTLESKDPSARPEINGTVDTSGYERIVIGFPIWWYTAPRIIQTFIEQNDLKGKEVYLFATSGGSSVDKAEEDLRKQYPSLNIVSGKLLNTFNEEDVKNWMEEK